MLVSGSGSPEEQGRYRRVPLSIRSEIYLKAFLRPRLSCRRLLALTTRKKLYEALVSLIWPRSVLPWRTLWNYNECGLERVCPYCFQFLVPDSYRVRLKPKMKVTPQIEKVLKQEAKNHKLNMKQTKLLKKYRESRSVLLVTCNSCNKTTRHYGKSRDFLTTTTHNSGTPSIKSSLSTPDVKVQSANKVTPVSCSRLGSKGNSPSSLPRTCVSGQATTSSASKTPRNSKFHFSKLKRMLNLEEKERSQKADLKTFLTLL